MNKLFLILTLLTIHSFAKAYQREKISDDEINKHSFFVLPSDRAVFIAKQSTSGINYFEYNNCKTYENKYVMVCFDSKNNQYFFPNPKKTGVRNKIVTIFNDLEREFNNSKASNIDFDYSNTRYFDDDNFDGIYIITKNGFVLYENNDEICCKHGNTGYEMKVDKTKNIVSYEDKQRYHRNGPLYFFKETSDIILSQKEKVVCEANNNFFRFHEEDTDHSIIIVGNQKNIAIQTKNLKDNTFTYKTYKMKKARSLIKTFFEYGIERWAYNKGSQDIKKFINEECIEKDSKQKKFQKLSKEQPFCIRTLFAAMVINRTLCTTQMTDQEFEKFTEDSRKIETIQNHPSTSGTKSTIKEYQKPYKEYFTKTIVNPLHIKTDNNVVEISNNRILALIMPYISNNAGTPVCEKDLPYMTSRLALKEEKDLKELRKKNSIYTQEDFIPFESNIDHNNSTESDDFFKIY